MGDMVDDMPSPPSTSPGSNYSGSMDGSARKQKKRTSTTAASGADSGAGMGSQSGPPYICPTCQTSYSRLEYLRRHERRHADIRPFVCECGKGFSRSDVLSRHKRQCAVHLNGGAEEGGAQPGGSLKAATVGASRKSSTSRAKKNTQRNGRKSGEIGRVQNADDDQQEDPIRRDFAQSPSMLMSGATSFPFQQSALQPPSAPPPLLPPAPYGTDMSSDFARVSNLNASSFGNISHHLSALSNFTNQQHNYPSSPESNGTVSQHSSPRFAARDMSRHGSNGSRFSLKKSGSSFDQMNARVSGTSANPSSHYPQEFWEALDPAAKAASALVGNDYVSGPPSSHPSFCLPAEVSGVGALASAASTAGNVGVVNPILNGGVTTPRGEPQRFSVSTGPLSPFSSIALTSSMSPYLSAFSNARDTPFVASPSRGGIPGTPGSNLNIFDWTMRPPSKPASSTNNTAKRDSISMQGSSSSSGMGTATKRKREEEEGGNKPEDSLLLSADADERSAAALLDSLRNAGPRPQLLPTVNQTGGETSQLPASSSDDSHANTSAATTASSTVQTTPSLSTSQPSESFFEQRNATVGPEAFLLRLQGGAQEERRERNIGPNDSMIPSLGVDLIGQQLFEGVGNHSLSQFGSNSATPLFSWESVLFGTDAAGGESIPAPLSTTTSMGWLMSPGIQQIINSFATNNPVSIPGDNGSYFSGAPVAPPEAPIPVPNAVELNTIALTRAMSDVKNPFYIPPQLFRPCYQVEHWNLPPITRLSMLALHSQQNLLKHFPVIHEPTFRLDTTPGCVAFAMTMLGCHRHGRMWWTGEEAVPRQALDDVEDKKESQGSTRNLMTTTFDEEDGQELVRPIVMTDKTDRLMRSFSTQARSSKDRFAIVVALTLFQANEFLSSDASARDVAALNHNSLVTLARKAGMFDPKQAHSGRKVTYTGEEVLRSTIFESTDLCFSYSYLPAYLPSCSDDEKIWRRWCELAARRRTAYLVFVMDSIASLDAGVSTQVSLDEIAHLHLPTPDTVWRAPTTDTWKKALEEYHGPTLDEALKEVLGTQRQEEETVKAASIQGRHGPFARLILIVALLRGIVHLLEDRKKRLSRPSPLQAWLSERKVDESKDDVVVYKVALNRWREAWDADSLCVAASASTAREQAAKLGLNEDDKSWLGTHYLFASKTASGATPLSDDALPLYWLALMLLEYAMLETSVDTKKPDLLQSAESFQASRKDKVKIEDVEGGQTEKESYDYRSLLRFAKAFVTNDDKWIV